MKAHIFVFMPISILLFCCSTKKNSSVITYQVSRSDYEDKIFVSGTVQAVVNYPVSPPSMEYEQLTILRLAADGAFVKKGDTLCVLNAPELVSRYKDSKSTLDSLRAGLKKAEADNQLKTALLEAQLATSEAQVKISSLDSLRIQFVPKMQQELLKLEMKKTMIEKEKTEKKLAATKMIGETEIRQINARIIQQKAMVTLLTDRVNSLTIIAQRDGIVMRTETPVFSIMGGGKIGGPIKEGSVLFLDNPVLQFPDLSRMQISGEVAEADFKKLEKGQQVRITVDAAEKLSTTGKVNRKNLIGRNAQRYSDLKVKFYEVIIDVDSCHSMMKPGLSASCEITLTEEKDTLFVPTLAIFERDSAKVVYVMKKQGYAPVRVRTGLSGSSYTIITDGLKGDEIIALSEPPGRLIITGNDIKESSNSITKHNSE
jgi:multidrug efflux pump subunit AcrA (membrane-fusion protein)